MIKNEHHQPQNLSFTYLLQEKWTSSFVCSLHVEQMKVFCWFVLLGAWQRLVVSDGFILPPRSHNNNGGGNNNGNCPRVSNAGEAMTQIYLLLTQLDELRRGNR
jgi:hypothetical protein